MDNAASYMEQLLEQYYLLAFEVPLEEFIRRALTGEWGRADRKSLLTFLDQVEVIILGNIETHTEEAPGLEWDVDAARTQTLEEIGLARMAVLEAFPAR